MSLIVLPGLDVVAGPQVAEARLFGLSGLVEQLCRGELLMDSTKPTAGLTAAERRKWTVWEQVGCRQMPAR